jgi:hypothetical protein
LVYIRDKVDRLAQVGKYNNKTRDAVQRHLSSNANNTFLWVALVCQGLEKVPQLKVPAKLSTFPPGLDSLYWRMMDQIHHADNTDPCMQILAIISTVYQPITLTELTSFVETLKDVSDNHEALAEIVGLCGSFLTLRDRTIYFVHQSAKDFLLGKAVDKVFPSGKAEVHYTMLSRSREIMSRTLQRDMYGLHAPGFPIDSVKPPDPDPLSAASYSCVYWVDHLCEIKNGSSEIGLGDNGIIHVFLKEHFLHWLEALSLLKSILSGILSVHKLERFFRVSLRHNSALSLY